MVVRWISALAVTVTFGILATAGCSWASDASDAGAKAASSTDDTLVDDEAGNPPEVATSDDMDDIFGPVDEKQPTPAEAPVETVVDAAAPAALANAKVHELTERVVALQTEVEELKSMLDSLQQAIARVQDPSEFSRQALGAMAEDADLRSNLGQMLQGKVRLVNNTGEPVILYVNGTPWTVVTGDSYVLAPVGTVSFLYDGKQKPIFKGIQEWTENEDTGLFELEYNVGEASSSTTEHSVMKVPAR